MKIAIIGYSGSGKSTLARRLAEAYALPVFHFDVVQFLPEWRIRPQEEKARLTEEFLNTHDEWVIDGNYTKLFFDRRMAEADRIVFLSFNRFTCLFRAYRRYQTNKGQTRPDMAQGCTEKFDAEFASWILWKGRTAVTRRRFQSVVDTYGDKVTVIKNQKQLDAYIRSIDSGKEC